MRPDQSERLAIIALSLRGLGPARLQRQREEHGGSYSAMLRSMGNSHEVAHMLRSAEEAVDRTLAFGARLTTREDPDYPERLLHLGDPPAFVVLKGDESVLRAPMAAIVGAREMSRYGERVARELSAALAASGVCVVSGLARGIDAAAHSGALEVSGLTCAVLGTGIDLTYPAGHAQLQRTIGEIGLLVTECPPGARPAKGSFPKRNRIIAALADLIIVVEAGRRSGALTTAQHALDLGRTVAAVPGPIDSASSVGANILLRDGGHVITGVDDALHLMGAELNSRAGEFTDSPPLEQAILGALSHRAMTPEELVDATGAGVAECMSAITALELRGTVQMELTGEITRRTIGKFAARGVRPQS